MTVNPTHIARKHLLRFEADSGMECPVGAEACQLLIENAVTDAVMQVFNAVGLGDIERRLKAAEDVCYAVQQASATSVVHVTVAKALREWQEARGL